MKWNLVAALSCCLFSILVPGTPSKAQTVVTFDVGSEGWDGPQGGGGATMIEAVGGNPGAHLHTVFNDFGITFTNATNQDFVFDYTQQPTVTLTLDVKVDAIDFGGIPVARPWLVELRDLDGPPAGFPWVSVWFKLADISQAVRGGWTTFSVTIDDTSAAALPSGWGGFGAEDALGNPMLPADRTFTDVLAGIDEIAYSTLEPGFVFGFTDFDVRLDNISIGFDGAQIFADGFETGDTSNW